MPDTPTGPSTWRQPLSMADAQTWAGIQQLTTERDEARAALSAALLASPEDRAVLDAAEAWTTERHVYLNDRSFANAERLADAEWKLGATVRARRAGGGE